MSQPFVAEIRMFAGNFAPTGWALCNGQLMPISQNTALFSLLGTFYGGDGRSTFALPNLEDSAPIGQGSGAGLSQRFVGEQSGAATVTLITTEMPSHAHNALPKTGLGNSQTPSAESWAGSTTAKPYVTANPNVAMNPGALSITGSGFPHNNMPPFLVVTFIIALQGVFPARN